MSSQFQSKVILTFCLILALFSGSISFARTQPSRKLSDTPATVKRQDLPAGASFGLGSNSYSPHPSLLTAPSAVPQGYYYPQAPQQNNNMQMMAMAAPLVQSLFGGNGLGGRNDDSSPRVRARSTRSLDAGSDSSSFSAPAPARQSDVPLRESKDVSDLSWAMTKNIENVIGRNQGYSLNSPVGWAKLKSDGSVQIQGSSASHCTSATHAQFLATIGALSKTGKVKLSNENLQALNSDLFRDAWNSNGYGPARLIELLGGQNFKEVSAAQKGDFVKLDRKNGPGHTAIFSHMSGDQICFWSSNRPTNGVGENCEPLSNFKEILFSRLNDLSSLQAHLDHLGEKLKTDPALAKVRSAGGNATVALSSVSISPARDLRAPAQIQVSDASPVRPAFQ